MLFLLLWLWMAWKLLVLVRFLRFVLRLNHMWLYWSTIAAVRSKMAQGSRRCGRRSCLQLVEHFVRSAAVMLSNRASGGWWDISWYWKEERPDSRCRGVTGPSVLFLLGSWPLCFGEK